MRYISIGILVIGILLLITGFLFANAAIIHPTGVEYKCQTYSYSANQYCYYTQSKESDLAWLYVGAGLIVLLAGGFLYTLSIGNDAKL